MKQQTTPYQFHLFVCCKKRDGKRKSCGDQRANDLKKQLKESIRDQGWKGKVRISDSGCLGKCEEGPNLMIYPTSQWFSHVEPSDIREIIETIESSIT